MPNALGGNPIEKRSTRIPVSLAARKWPSSCMKMSTPSVMAVYINMFRVCILSSRLQPAARFPDERPCDPVSLYDILQGPCSGDRDMVQRSPDQERDFVESNLPPKEEFHGNLIRRVQNCRGRAAPGERLDHIP